MKRKTSRRRRPVTAETARRLLLALPGVEEGPCYGTAGFRVRKKFIARLRDDDTVLVVKCGFDERDFRLRVDPGAFFTTDHYRGYPTVLVRLDRVDETELTSLLEHAWRLAAPKRLVAEHDRANGVGDPSRGAGSRSSPTGA
ncbi:MAG: MmcQ/YjbR family DNA-binding protein [Gemmatimonadales bacterium]